MAIVDKLSVEVTSGGQVLTEHEIPRDEVHGQTTLIPQSATKHVIKYLQAIPNVDFQIKCGIGSGFNFGAAEYLAFKVYVDGSPVMSTHAHKAKYRTNTGMTILAERSRAVVKGQWKAYALHWGELVTNDDHPNVSLAEMKQRYADLGTIRIEVWRRKGTKTRLSKPKDLWAEDKAVPEKAFKGEAIDLATRRGAPRDIKPPTSRIRKILDSFPTAVFTFRYRSKSALQVLGIIPRSPSPVPLEARDPGTLTHEEAIELIRRQQAQLDTVNASIKKENANVNMRDNGGVKREAPDPKQTIAPGRNKRARQEIEIIDLTDI